MNGRIERNEIARMADPNLIHLVPMIRAAEEKRRWYHRVNWGPVVGGLVIIGVSGLAWWGFIYAALYANGWLNGR